MEARRLTKVPALDGLRGVAVLLVLVHHIPVMNPYLVGRWTKQGDLGVDIFFVLSGFLITAILLGEQSSRGSIRFGNFYLRRALRLLPALVGLLAAHALFAAWVGIPGETERESSLAVLFYYSNIPFLAPPHIAEGLGHLWSLAVEEQFYLVWPLLIAVLMPFRRRFAVVLLVSVALLIGVFLYRQSLLDDPIGPLVARSRTLSRVDQLVIGGLVAQLWVRRLLPTRFLAPLAWIAVAWLVYVIKFDVSHQFLRQGQTLVGIAVAVVIAAIMATSWRGSVILSIAPLRLAGKVSYAMYLWHFMIFKSVLRYGNSHGWDNTRRIIVGFSLTAAAAALSWVLIERPALRLKDRLSRRPGDPTGAPKKKRSRRYEPGFAVPD